jgi:hypothetical protein
MAATAASIPTAPLIQDSCVPARKNRTTRRIDPKIQRVRRHPKTPFGRSQAFTWGETACFQHKSFKPATHQPQVRLEDQKALLEQAFSSSSLMRISKAFFSY